MAEIVTLPKLGLSEFGEVVAWEVDVGDRVETGDVLAVIESEKASAELESPADGVLLATYVDEGEEIAIEPGRPMAAVGEEGESPPTPEGVEVETAAEPAETAEEPKPSVEKATAESEGGITATPRARKLARREDVDVGAVRGSGPQGAVTETDVERYLETGGKRTTEAAATATPGTNGAEPPEKVSPRARRYAEEHGVDLAGVQGTGPQGSVVERDVRAAEGTPEPSPETTGGLTVRESRELTGTRATIAERLSASAREKPHVTGTREIGIERLEAVQDRLAEKGLDVSLNDLVLHFVGETLRDFPEFNAHFEDGRHELVEEVNVGYAVDGPRGLVVPVVENVENRSLESLASRRQELVGRVLDDDYAAEDLQGGTFTVTNVGALGMDVSASIINPPEVAILAVGRAKPTPVERDGEVEFERAMTFSLTIDHRVLDGADSGAFLERLAEYLEFPGSVLEEAR